MREHTIAPARQLRLVLSDAASIFCAPEEVWDSLPEELRRQILLRLAPLLHRWFVARRAEP